jgi:putative transposase
VAFRPAGKVIGATRGYFSSRSPDFSKCAAGRRLRGLGPGQRVHRRRPAAEPERALRGCSPDGGRRPGIRGGVRRGLPDSAALHLDYGVGGVAGEVSEGALRLVILSRRWGNSMVLYRRARVPGGCFFFTVALRDRSADTLTAHVDVLRTAMRRAKVRWPFVVDAMVVLPEHLHAVWTLPEGDADFSSRWRAIKAGFVRGLRTEGIAVARNDVGEADVWQRRFWEHQIRDELDYRRHVDYVHFNPVKHGWARRVVDWPWSSFHRHVAEGVLPADWAGDAEGDGAFGE